MAQYYKKRPDKAKYRKYGCLVCADYRHGCDGTQPCKYADILDKYKNYNEYDRAARKTIREIFKTMKMS